MLTATQSSEYLINQILIFRRQNVELLDLILLLQRALFKKHKGKQNLNQILK